MLRGLLTEKEFLSVKGIHKARVALDSDCSILKTGLTTKPGPIQHLAYPQTSLPTESRSYTEVVTMKPMVQK